MKQQIFTDCGISGNESSIRSKRIISGEDAVQNELPYMAQLRYKKSHKCGGTIISPNLVLTSAHCFYRGSDLFDNPIDYEIVLGSIKSSGEGGQVFEVDRIYIPAEFNWRLGQSDIAVAKVSYTCTVNYTKRNNCYFKV